MVVVPRAGPQIVQEVPAFVQPQLQQPTEQLLVLQAKPFVVVVVDFGREDRRPF